MLTGIAVLILTPVAFGLLSYYAERMSERDRRDRRGW